MITKKQKIVLDYVIKYQTKNGYSPSLEEIKDRFKLASVSTSHHYIKKLEDAGLLNKRHNHPRAISIVEDSDPAYIPFLGKISAGNLADTVEEIDNAKLARFLGSSKQISKINIFPLNQIILSDVVAGIKNLPDESCDMIIIDPPYNIGKDFGNNMDKRELSEYIAWSKEWINESIRVLKPTGTMFIYGFSEILAHLSVEIPLNKRWLIWHYTNKNVASLDFWQRSHESIICTWKNRPVFNKDAVREPYTEGFLNGAAGKVRKGTVGRFSGSGKETIYSAHEGGALPRDVIKIPALAGGAGMNERWFMCKQCNDIFEPRKLKEHLNHEIKKHPTQKPLELCRKLIKSSMPKSNGVVLVPFVGSGAECAAAKELGQNYIGFEINPDYVKLAQRIVDSVHTPKKLS